MIYDFECKKCNKTEEKMVSRQDLEQPILCECGEPMERQFPEGTNFILKGNWYKNNRRY